MMIMKKNLYIVILVGLLLIVGGCGILVIVPPSKPTQLNAVAISSTEIKLTWQDNSDNEEGFKIERKTEVEEWSQITTVEENATEYTDSELKPNKTYYYRVRAYNEGGYSGYSNEAYAKTNNDYIIQVNDKQHIVGRISYIDVKVVDKNGTPISGIPLKMYYSDLDGKQHPVIDELLGTDLFITDKNGVAWVSVLSHNEILNQRFYVYVSDDSSIHTDFTISFTKPEWLFVLWMTADNNLEDFALKDLLEMQNENESISVLAFIDGRDQLLDSVQALDEFGNWQIIDTFNEDFNSGDAKLLEDKLKYAFSFDSNHYSLILWNHGNAWLNDSASLSSTYLPQGICYDNTSNNFISIFELRSALEHVCDGSKLDIIGMDACLMASIEVMYELKDVANYIVASSFNEPTDGWNYKFLKEISHGDQAIEVGRKIVDAYMESYRNNTKWEDLGISLAVYDMSKINEVSRDLSNLADILIDSMDMNLRDIIHNFYPALTQYYLDDNGVPLNILVDISSFVDFIYFANYKINNPKLGYYAQKVQQDLEDLIVYEYAKKRGITLTNPLSIFMPNNANIVTNFADDYNTLLFTREHLWSDFLEAWLQVADVLLP